MSVLKLDNFSVLNVEPFNYTIEKEIVCLTGASGTGKSVLLRAIADLILHKGEAFLDGQKSSAIKASKWRQQVGLLAAESAWWFDSIGEHFSQSEEKFSDETLIEKLNLPVECFSWQVSRCSTGEKQRLALARLLENQPSVLLLDEPTASLDPDSVDAVENIILEYSKQQHAPVIWVSHDPKQVARVADRQLEINENKIEEVSK